MWEKRTEGLPASARAASPLPNSTAIIGKAMSIKGNIYSEEDLYVDGEVEGTLELNGSRLTIGPSGRAVATVSAREVDVQGSIEGNVTAAGRVAIRKDGNLVGDITAAAIMIDDGAFFRGSVDIVRTETKSAG